MLRMITNASWYIANRIIVKHLKMKILLKLKLQTILKNMPNVYVIIQTV